MQQVMAILGQDEEGRPVRVEVLDEALLDETYQVQLLTVIYSITFSIKFYFPLYYGCSSLYVALCCKILRKVVSYECLKLNVVFGYEWMAQIFPVQLSGGELLELRLLDKKWNRSFFICRTCIHI